MNGGSSASHPGRTPCVPLFVLCLLRVETEGLLDYQGGRGSFPLYGGTFARSYSVSKIGFFSEKGGGNSVKVRISTGKAIQ